MTVIVFHLPSPGSVIVLDLLLSSVTADFLLSLVTVILLQFLLSPGPVMMFEVLSHPSVVVIEPLPSPLTEVVP